jgi:hypothetical protein
MKEIFASLDSRCHGGDGRTQCLSALSFKGASTADFRLCGEQHQRAARAIATGIEGDGGKDKIRNSGNITLMAPATGVDEVDASALGGSASLNVSGNVAIKGGAAGDVTGTAASNATVLAEAEATGIDGGGDNDDIANSGIIKLLPSSSADGIRIFKCICKWSRSKDRR